MSVHSTNNIKSRTNGATHIGDIASSDTCPVPEYYAANASPAPRTIALEDTLWTDIAIVGGGYTGLSTALHLGMQGVRSVVLESRGIGWGASSRNFGQVVPYLKHNPSTLIARLGNQEAERLIEHTGLGPDLVFDLIDRFGIQCAANRAGLLFALHSDSGRNGLEGRTRFWRERGAPIEMLGAAETRKLVGSDYYTASSLDLRGGTINPVGYVRGLAQAAMEMGADIFTESPVQQIQATSDGWSINTAKGRVNAKRVILATNGYTPRGLWSGLRDSIIPMRAHQAISAPLPPQIAERLLPQGHALTDTRHLFSGVRMYRDGRIQVGVDGPAFSTDGQAMLHKATVRLQKLIPDLQDIKWQHQWSGWIAMTFDQLPHLHELAPGLWAGLGYSGRGIAHATMMGRDLARVATDGSHQDLSFKVTPLQPRMASRFAKPLVGSLLNYYRIVDALAERR